MDIEIQPVGTISHEGRKADCEPAQYPVFSCVKNDHFFLNSWYRHYKSLGFGPFYIVDDGSEVSVSKSLPFPDVHVFTPTSGSFRSSKTAWLKTLMERFAHEGQWVLTVDADEFLDPPTSSIRDALKEYESDGRAAVPGMLVDMLPDLAALEGAEADCSDMAVVFCRHLFGARAGQGAYAKSPPVRWAFGRGWRNSFYIDARYQLFGTIDVLRKIPLFRYRHDIRLNQGFHDLHFNEVGALKRKSWSGPVFPIRHYKLAKLFYENLRGSLKDDPAISEAYHARTAENIAAMAAMDLPLIKRNIEKLQTVCYDKNVFFRRSRVLSGWIRSVLFA